MAGRRKGGASSSSTSLPQLPIQIGNCEVSVNARNFSTTEKPNCLQISLSKTSSINISVRRDITPTTCDCFCRFKPHKKVEDGKVSSFEDDYMFVLVNLKDSDSHSNNFLQQVLELYTKELPTMNYAANTGKQSKFLEKCVFNGRYSTLLLKYNHKEGSNLPGEVMAAITYQIVPTDTKYAEIPLAAVQSAHQHKGYGCFLYKELRKRLQNVGIHTIYCWGDRESEGFWIKQGFTSIAQVNRKGKTQRLPIKADMRKALCYPGGSTLMVCHLNQKNSAEPSGATKPFLGDNTPGGPALTGGNCDVLESQKQVNFEVEDSDCKELKTDEFSGKFKGTQGTKRRAWEASLSSLKSKKVKGTHQIPSDSDFICSLDSQSDRLGTYFNACSLNGSKSCCFEEAPPVDPLSNKRVEDATEGGRPDNLTSETLPKKEITLTRKSFKVTLMNIADDTKKRHLTEVIEKLGGSVSPDGISTTHIVTGKVRKTLNFCTALCSGSWVVSSSWLKESFRKGRFVDELPHVLHDEDYVLKYRIELKDAILRAKAKPGSLLKGYNICITAHVQPPVKILSAIVRSAGANVIYELDEVEKSRTILIACEDDMEEALVAAKKGIWSFSSEWLMNCIMRQELDLEAQQFAQSL